MTTPNAFHGCFGRLTRDASDSNNWITVKRSKKNRKKVGTLREISNSNRVLKVTFSNSKKPMMHHAVDPKVHSASFPSSNLRSVTSKSNKNFKKNHFSSKKPKNSLDKFLAAFSEDLKKVMKTHEFLQESLTKADQQMQKVKKEISLNANLLLLHKGLVKHLQQLQIDRHPVILKSRNVIKLQKKYEDYINSVDAIRDTVGKLKVQSVKIREGIGKWKQQQCASTQLLNEIVENDSTDIPYDDFFEYASSSTTNQEFQENYFDSDEDWVTIIEPPSPDRKCRFVNHERKRSVKPHIPACPFQYPKQFMARNRPNARTEILMETPIVNENSILARKLNKLQNDLQNLKNKKQNMDEKISYLRHEIRSFSHRAVHPDLIKDTESELNSSIIEGTWIEKEIVRISSQISEIRKRQGFTKIARAFLTSTLAPTIHSM
jgi:hypothetical protein